MPIRFVANQDFGLVNLPLYSISYVAAFAFATSPRTELNAFI